MDFIFTFLEYSWTQRFLIWVPQSCPCDALKAYGGSGSIALWRSESQHSEVKGHHHSGSFILEEACQIIIEHGLRVGLDNVKKKYLSYTCSNQTTVPRLPVRSLVSMPINLPHITKKYTNLFLCFLVSP